MQKIKNNISQDKIHDYVISQKEPLTVRQVAKHFNADVSNTGGKLRKLAKFRMLSRRNVHMRNEEGRLCNFYLYSRGENG